MTMRTESAGASSSPLAELAIQRGLLDRNQLRIAIYRQAELARGGIKFSLNQTLLERQFLTLEQFKELMQQCVNAPHSGRTATRTAEKICGNYKIIAQLADKGQCKVFHAEDTVMGRNVVLKVMPRALLGDAERYERFKREMKIAGKLSHPNIVLAYGTDQINGNPVIVLEYVEGESLQNRLEREGNIPEEEAWQIVREIAKGLAYAADLGIVHRNIKPDNILFAMDGRVKILDMGCAKVLTDSNDVTVPGTTIGTPFYMSPEQAMGAQNLDVRSDVYSLGCTLYHMLTGSVPFLAEHCAQVMHQHIKAPRPDPRDVLPEISEHSAALVKRMMAIKPDARPGSAPELIALIDAIIQRLPQTQVIERPTRVITRSDAEVAAPPQQESVKPVQSLLTRAVSALKCVFG